MKNSTTLSALGLLAALLTSPVAAQQDDGAFYDQSVFGAMTWRELGPANFGGRVVDIAVHPQDTSLYYVATGSGGLFKTTNNGTTWKPVFEREGTVSIGDIALAPSDPEVVYVGTGEANNQRSSYWGDGVYKSNDGGETWLYLGLRGTDHIGRIVVHPQNPDIVYVAALGALYSANRDRGLYRTTDGGYSWTCVKHLGDDVGFVDVVIDPRNPDNLYAASYERRRRAWHFTEGGEGSRVWKSTDGGDSWERLGNGLPDGKLGRIGLCIFPGNPDILYAEIENLNPAPPPTAEPRTEGGEGEEVIDRKPPETDPDAEELYPFGQGEQKEAQDRRPRRSNVGGEIYRTDDGGASWRKTNTGGAVGGSPGYYYGQIRVDPQNANTVYVLSVPVHMSQDGGETWTPARRGRGGRGGGGARGTRGARGGARGEARGAGSRAPARAFANRLHVDHHALWIDPNDSGHALLGNDGGLSVTYDQGRSWDYMNDLGVGQFYAVAVDLRDPYWVYGGTQDNGTWGTPVRGATSAGLDRSNAAKIGGGDGFQVCVDPDDPNVVYYESQFGALQRRNLATGERGSIRPRAEKGSPRLRFNWMSPILLSPHNGQTVFFGSQYLHRSRNRGDAWETISPDLTTGNPDKIKGNVPHCTITTIAESPQREGLLWVGTDDGKVWVSRTGGERWVDLSDRFPGLPTDRPLWVSRVEASPHDVDTAYVAFTGYREDIRTPFLYLTTDSGETFRSIAHDLPQESVNVVREHPRNQNVLLVGTEFGAYVSIDGGGGWHRLGTNLPRVPVHDLLVHPREPHIVIGTHGRGMWVMDATVLEEITAQTLARSFQAFAPSDGVMLRGSINRGYTGARNWRLDNPFQWPTFRYYLRQDADEAVTIEVVDATGKTVRALTGSAEAGLHEVAWRQPQRGRGGRGGRGGGFQIPGRRRAAGPRPGQFAVKFTFGQQEVVLPFSVRDERGPSTVFGTPGDELDTGRAPDSGR